MTQPRGWSPTTVRSPWRPYREEVEPLARSLPFGEPEQATSGKVNREAWDEASSWHLGLEQSISPVDGTLVFRGAAENELKGVFVRWPVALVDEVRARVCPGVEGRSE